MYWAEHVHSSTYEFRSPDLWRRKVDPYCIKNTSQMVEELHLMHQFRSPNPTKFATNFLLKSLDLVNLRVLKELHRNHFSGGPMAVANWSHVMMCMFAIQRMVLLWRCSAENSAKPIRGRRGSHNVSVTSGGSNWEGRVNQTRNQT